MFDRREPSSLVALHELRDTEKRRLGQREPSPLRAEADLSAEAAVPRPRDAADPPTAFRWFSWLGLTAGATMLVGALALTAAMRPRQEPRVNLESPRPVCTPTRPPDAEGAVAGPRAPTPRPLVRPSPRPRPTPTKPPTISKPPAPICDGSDPLCGLNLGAIDDVGKKQGKRGHSPR